MEIFGYALSLSFDMIVFLLFLLVLGTTLYIKRKEVAVQKIASYFIYIVMYRTKWGLTWMDKISSKYRSAVQLFGYISVGIGFVGMIYVSLSILLFFLQLIFKPAVQQAGVSLVLPFTNIPGIGYLSFTHWVLSIFILAIVHEFSHGVVARAHNVPVRSSGFAVFALLLPIIPAAFVEPDEKKLSKMPDIVQYSVFAAGPMANLVLAFLIVMIFPFASDMTNSTLAPFEAKITAPVGFSYEILENQSYPAYAAGVHNGILFSIDGQQINDYAAFYNYASCLHPNQTVLLGTDKGNYSILTIQNPDPQKEGKGFIGVKPVQNERRIISQYAWLAPVYYWFRGFIKWLFLLNLFIGLANLLTLGIVDGGRTLQTALHSLFDNKGHAQKIWTIISMLFLGALVFALLVNYLGNPFALLFG